MSERRRARTKQPREGQSKKRKNLYEELKHELKSTRPRSERDKKRIADAKEWLEQNKPWLDTTAQETRELGISCEYHEMYNVVYEKKVGSVIFDNDDVSGHHSDEQDPYNLIDDSISQEDIDEIQEGAYEQFDDGWYENND